MQLSSSPVDSLSIVSDLVPSSKSDPLRQRSVLLLVLSQLLLNSESLVGLHNILKDLLVLQFLQKENSFK